MGIYNCADTLPEAIDSLLAQTLYGLEPRHVRRRSRDATYEVAERYRRTYPERITLLKNEQNMGLNYTLNRCLSIADGAYIARQDGDDMSMPTRFEKEAAILDAFPDIAIVSTAMTYFDENGAWGQSHPVLFPENRDFIAGTPFCHAPCMVRREAYQAVNGYTDDPALSARGGPTTSGSNCTPPASAARISRSRSMPCGTTAMHLPAGNSNIASMNSRRHKSGTAAASAAERISLRAAAPLR